MQFSETSTGVVNDIKAIGEIVAKTPAILVVDAISGLGATDLPTDAWHVDVCVAGSQKALMVPPGLAYVAVSEKAWKVVEQCGTPRFYFDWVAARKKMSGDSAQTPYTPAVSLMVAQNRAIELIREEGLADGVRASPRCSAAPAKRASRPSVWSSSAPTTRRPTR